MEMREKNENTSLPYRSRLSRLADDPCAISFVTELWTMRSVYESVGTRVYDVIHKNGIRYGRRSMDFNIIIIMVMEQM